MLWDTTVNTVHELNTGNKWENMQFRSIPRMYRVAHGEQEFTASDSSGNMQDFTRIYLRFFSKHFIIQKISQNFLWQKVRGLVEFFKEINLKNVSKLAVYYHCFKMKTKKLKLEDWSQFYCELN